MVHCEIKTSWKRELTFRVEEEGSHASWGKTRIQFNEYNYAYIKLKQTSMNNVLPIDIDFSFKIYISTADRREDTGFHTR